MSICNKDLIKTRDKAKNISYSCDRLNKERSKSNYYFKNQINISQNNEYNNILENDNHHENTCTQNQNISVHEDNDKIIK